MKIQQQNYINFNAKYTLGQSEKGHLDYIVTAMQKEHEKHFSNEKKFVITTDTIQLKSKDGIFYNKYMFKRKGATNPLTNCSRLELNGSKWTKSILYINNTTGEIESVIKPFFYPLSKVIKKATEAIDNFCKFYDNPSVIEKVKRSVKARYVKDIDEYLFNLRRNLYRK